VAGQEALVAVDDGGDRGPRGDEVDGIALGHVHK
jgi:hypothetical protein